MTNLIITSIEQGLIFSILALGVYISNKILKMADLSVEASFPFGGFLLAYFLLKGINPFLAIIISFLLGSLTGLMTGFLYSKLNLNPLISGILTMNIFYSINLRLGDGSNVALYQFDNIFDKGNKLFILLGIVLIVKLLLDLFLNTELGYLIKATGDNEVLVRSLGFNSGNLKILALMLSNALIAFSGILMSQSQGFVDITMGRTALVTGLASLIIGETLFKNIKVLKPTTKVVLGSIIYRIIGSFAIDLGMKPSDLSAVNAIILLIFLVYNEHFKNKIKLNLFKGEKKDALSKKYI